MFRKYLKFKERRKLEKILFRIKNSVTDLPTGINSKKTRKTHNLETIEIILILVNREIIEKEITIRQDLEKNPISKDRAIITVREISADRKENSIRERDINYRGH